MKAHGWAALARDPVFAVGLFLILGFTAMAIFAPQIAPYDPYDFSWPRLLMPSRLHLLGTNDIGQDIFSEVVYGARISLLVGFTAAAISTVVAWALGLLAGYSSRVDTYVTSFADAFLAVPKLPLMILLMAFLGPSLWNVILVLGLFTWPPFMRVIRAQVASTKEKTYVEAARALGAGPLHLLWRHIFPETASIGAVKFILSAQNAVFAEATLAFLGLADPATKSWGIILNRAFNYPLTFVTNTWVWWLAPPALCIALLVVGLTLVGHSLEECMNPVLRKGKGPLRRKQVLPRQEARQECANTVLESSPSARRDSKRKSLWQARNLVRR